MSTSLLYHTWGIRGNDYIHARYEKGCTIFRVEQKESSLRSSCCGNRNVKKRGATERTFKTTPVGNRPVSIELPVQWAECLKCGAVRRVDVQFAKRRRSYTKGFERYALDLSRHMTIQDVAHHLNVSWNTIKDIQKRYLHRRFDKPKLRKLKRMATADYMKDDQRRVWQQDDKEAAAFLLDDWIKRAAVSGIQMLIRFGKTLATYRSGILAYYDFDGLSTGPLEGTNNKIKTLQKMAYGFLDREFLKLKIKGLHEPKYALVG